MDGFLKNHQPSELQRPREAVLSSQTARHRPRESSGGLPRDVLQDTWEARWGIFSWLPRFCEKNPWKKNMGFRHVKICDPENWESLPNVFFGKSTQLDWHFFVIWQKLCLTDFFGELHRAKCWTKLLRASHPLSFGERNEGFHKSGIPNSWMVSIKMDDLGVTLL